MSGLSRRGSTLVKMKTMNMIVVLLWGQAMSKMRMTKGEMYDNMQRRSWTPCSRMVLRAFLAEAWLEPEAARAAQRTFR